MNYLKKYCVLGVIAVLFLVVVPLRTFAYTWTDHSGSSGAGNWFGIASDSSGMKLVAANAGDYVYTSTDGGVTWTNHGGSSGIGRWFTVASDSTGMRLAAAQYNPGAGPGGYIYTSTDGGVTWSNNLRSSGLRNWRGLASDSTGMNLVAAAWNDHIVVSTDGGVTWVDHGGSPLASWMSVASDSTGTRLAAANYNGYIYTSTDGGVTWSDNGGSSGGPNWNSVASDSTGMKLVAAANGGYVKVSTDGGVTWTTNGGASGVSDWYGVTSDTTGRMLAAVQGYSFTSPSGGYIWVSTDGGMTWVQQTGATRGYWYGITSNSSGSRLAATNNSNTIWEESSGRIPPTVHTVSGTVSGTTATLTGHLDTLGTGTTTTVGFNFGGTIISAGMLSAPGTFTATTTVACGTTYSFFATADNLATGGGVAVTDLTPVAFSTGTCRTPPVVETTSSSAVTQTTATITGTLVSIGTGSTSVRVGFNWGLTTSYGSTASGPTLTATGPFSANLTGLTCETLYHFQATGTNIAGTAVGADLTFTTSPCHTPPVVVTTSSSAITQISATITGNLTAIGYGSTSAHVGFNWGLTTSYGSTASAGTFTSPGSFSSALTGLVCGTTYHFQATANNGLTSATGADMRFTTNACMPPEVTTVSSGSITQTSAVVNGNLVNHGGVTDVGFTYGLDTTYSEPPVSAGSLSTSGPFSASLTGLACGTLYHFRAYGHGAGMAYGADMTFTTADCSFDVTTLPATLVSDVSGQINGQVTSIGTGTSGTVSFNYGTTTSLGSVATVAFHGGSMSTSDLPYAFNTSLTGLDCGTTYYYQASVTNNLSVTQTGTILNFTTSSCVVALPPVVVTDAADTVTTSSANLNGDITSLSTGGYATLVGFNYNTVPTTTTTADPSVSASSMYGFGVGPFSIGLASLTCNTTYHFRAWATNSGGTAYGADMTFTTNACPATIPTVTTTSSSAITMTTATINGNLTSLGGDPSATTGFNYGTSTSYGSTATGPTLTATGPFSANLTGLTCHTTYHFQATATNTAGTGVGADMTFTTSPCPIPPTLPTVTTTPASSVGFTSATLNGSLTNLGGAGSATIGFNYGPTTSYGSTASAGTTTHLGAFTSPLTGLLCNTVYHFQAFATNLAGTAVGADKQFLTGVCLPSVTTIMGSVTSGVGGRVVLNGHLDSTGGAAIVSTGFNYGPSTSYGTTVGSLNLRSPASFTKDVLPVPTWLNCNTPIHVRAYATNAAGTAYGDDVLFCK